MERKIYKQLLDWKECDKNKPLMILGVRQCGKTYVINEFGESEFKHYKYINLLENKDVIELYDSNLNSDIKFNRFKLLLNFDIEKEDSLLFIDEIQESENLIAELKYFCEKHNKAKIICAGSLFGVALKRKNASFPVGKVSMIYMYPMDFEEYLLACSGQMLIDEIYNCFKTDKQLKEPLHSKALNYYYNYLITGGMPESVQNMIDVDFDYINYDRNILRSIKNSYVNDMKKYVSSPSDTLKIMQIYNSVPAQLSKKFQYSKVEKKARSREYELQLNWLLESFLVCPCYAGTNPEIPLEGFKDISAFKLYLSDVGILTTMLSLPLENIINDNISLYKGNIAENYVANELMALDYKLYYWINNATAEVDFLISTKDGVIPIEVNAGDNTQSKSLKIYMDKYKPKYAIRISTKDFGFTNNIKSIPLYATFCLKDIQAI